jgi:lysozyme
MFNGRKYGKPLSAGLAALTIPFVIYFEGEIREGYKDPIGIVTACVGHTETAVFKKKYTAEECRKLLEYDLEVHNQGMMDCVYVPLNLNQRASFLSFTFNVGVGAFCGSTLNKKLNDGDYAGACAELSRWTWAGGKQLPGLIKRRAAERELCERPYM